MSAPHILCVGAATFDTLFKVPAIPATPTKVLPTACLQLAGGMAASGGAAIVRLGGRVEYWARVGDDATGRATIADLAAAGLELSRIRLVPGGRSTVCTILVDDAGGRMVVPYYDPQLDPDPGWLPVERIPQFDALLVDARWPAGAARALGAARDCGRIAVLDADVSPPGVLEELAPLASHVVFSEPALQSFAGAGPIEEALHAAATRLPGFVGVTLGAAGFSWLERGAIRHAPAPEVQAVDTLSAGDVFHGAFTLALAEGADPATAGRFANAAAALKCTRFGGRAGAPTRAEVEAFLRTSAA
ncbi:MAG: ribokinase [Opitutaceae bacterium]|nr:ribokinase [Opitutaceae bacterium]